MPSRCNSALDGHGLRHLRSFSDALRDHQSVRPIVNGMSPTRATIMILTST